jgi:hypothetical protein
VTVTPSAGSHGPPAGRCAKRPAAASGPCAQKSTWITRETVAARPAGQCRGHRRYRHGPPRAVAREAAVLKRRQHHWRVIWAGSSATSSRPSASRAASTSNPGRHLGAPGRWFSRQCAGLGLLFPDVVRAVFADADLVEPLAVSCLYEAAAGAGLDLVQAGQLGGSHHVSRAHIVDFQAHLDEARRPINTYATWGAAYQIMDGRCSGDGFWYFQPWLIGQDRERYEHAARDPDNLAAPGVRALADRRSRGWSGAEWPWREELAYVARRVHVRDVYLQSQVSASRSQAVMSSSQDWR